MTRSILFEALFIGALFLSAALTGCTTTPNVQTDCQQQGTSQYWHCANYPWYKKQCERFQ